MRVYKVKNYDEMSRKAANLIAAQIITKPDSVLGLCKEDVCAGQSDHIYLWYKQYVVLEIRHKNTDNFIDNTILRIVQL